MTDKASIQKLIIEYVKNGFTAESSAQAVAQQDVTLLRHTGTFPLPMTVDLQLDPAPLSKTFKVFGRDPALFLALFAIVVQFASTFFFTLTPDQQGVVSLVAGAVVALVGALTVAREKLAAALLGLTQAILGGLLAFGVHFDADQQGVVMALVAAVVGWYTRTQVTAPVDANGERVSK